MEATSKASLTAGLESGVDTFVFMHDSPLLNESEGLAKFQSVIVRRDGLFTATPQCAGGDIRGVFKECRDAKHVEELINQAAISERDQVFVMDTSAGWRVIPVENFIAAKQQAGFDARFMVVTESAAEAETMLSLMDFGVDGVVLRSEDSGEIVRFGSLRAGLDEERQKRDVGTAEFATVTEVRGAGSGDRVCVDCCCNMAKDEMLLVGNSSGALFGVLSEAIENAYVESRPFRFNAGPVHTYCLCPNGRTQYLSELKSGDEVVVVRGRADGGLDARTAVVGRCKVERRPLVLISAETRDGQTVSLFAQNAETCRVCILSPEDVFGGCSVVGLHPGDRILLRRDGSARHRGYAIEEYLVEK
jgi:3-dehydroquinate synthase II